MNIPLSLRIRQWSWWWMNVMETAHLAMIFWIGPFSKLAIQLWYREATSGFGPANGAFGYSRYTTGFRAVNFIYLFFLATQRAITTPISSGTGVRSGSSCQCTALHSSHTVVFIYLFISFGETSGTFDKISPPFSITEFFRMAPPTCSCCEPIYRAFFLSGPWWCRVTAGKSCYTKVQEEGEKRSPCAPLLCVAETRTLTAEMIEY